MLSQKMLKLQIHQPKTRIVSTDQSQTLKVIFFIHTTSDDQRPDTEPADRRFVNSYVAQKGN